MQPADLTPELIKDPKDLDGLDGIYDFLARLIILQAQNRISTRRAAVLAYITNQLLRTFAAIKRVQAEQEPQIVVSRSAAPGRLTGGKPVHVQQSLSAQQMLLASNAPKNRCAQSKTIPLTPALYAISLSAIGQQHMLRKPRTGGWRHQSGIVVLINNRVED